MQKLVQRIIAERIPCYFISPHLDDAVLSAGGLIQELAGKTEVTIITVFTKASGKDTLSARQFLRQCHYHDAAKLFSDRRAEDKRIASKLGIEAIHLGYSDALWRERPVLSAAAKALARLMPEFSKIYPTYRFHIARGRLSSSDDSLIETIAKDLRQRVPLEGESEIFCPQAIGNHIDHIVVRKACEQAFASMIAWSDFPYNVRLRNMQPEAWRWGRNIAKKKELIHHYRTQAAALFAEGEIPLIPEEYKPI